MQQQRRRQRKQEQEAKAEILFFLSRDTFSILDEGKGGREKETIE